MSASACKVLRTASSHKLCCRYIAGTRLPQSRHTFHTSPNRRREPEPPEEPWVVQEGPPSLSRDQLPLDGEGGLNVSDEGGGQPAKPKDSSSYGSFLSRAGRNIKRVKELPPVHVPQWFLDRNVVLREALEAVRKGMPSVAAPSDAQPSTTGSAPDQTATSLSRNEVLSETDGQASDRVGDHLSDKSKEDSEASARVNQHTLIELFCAVAAGLRIPSTQQSENATSSKPHVVLFCPKDGGSMYLDRMARSLATLYSTDFLRLDAQDIAKIGGEYLKEPGSVHGHRLSSLGYDTAQVIVSRSAYEKEDSREEEENDDGEENDAIQGLDRPPSSPHRGSEFGVGVIPIAGFSGGISDIINKFITTRGAAPHDGAPSSSKPIMMKVQQPKDNTQDLKLSLLIETLLHAPETKRVEEHNQHSALEGSSSSAPNAENEPSDPKTESTVETSNTNGERGSESLIILIEDYPQINTTISGGKFLDRLHDIVEARRREGQKVLVIGTASSKDLMRSNSRSGINEIQAEPRHGPARTIVIPINDKTPFRTLAEDQKLKVKAINLRHIRDMLHILASNPAQVESLASDWDLDVDPKLVFLTDLDKSVWSVDRVNRTATTALGFLKESFELNRKHLERALELLEDSDHAKYDWMANEKKQEKKRGEANPSSPKRDTEERMQRLRKKCNRYEKKLLNGIVDPHSIRTTFADVRAPPETIEALKTLTSLSLVRPDAFSYGVLATDRIPGLLLYGPPGTGKTLLARAVAKESGATVLEVSGSDVYDMYVGEGEKNVRAIFTLAKKLTPCIVFIDEADAILGSRGGSSNRTSHRELINQFLREWDGMTDLSAFIMVATNRPYDLDEASLRRLPRRLLVDLPVEKDREAILKIHLKNELLDPEVSLSQLASQTPFYSGSDLKNLAVAAALSCVREEFDTAASQKESPEGEKYEYPEKRTLHPRHFTHAMDEISASISEDMRSLSAIRKFDEKYGDRRGKRKKLGGYGFKTITDSEKMGSDAARVRNQT